MEKPFIVGITGGSGSGKTFVINELVKALGQGVCIVSQDHYYRSRDQQPKDARGITNFDTPESIDREYFVSDMRKLVAGEVVEKLEYTFNNPNKKPEIFYFLPKPVIIIEGLFVFHYTEIFDLTDLRIYVDARDHVRIRRRIIRDNQERGYDLSDVLYRYEHHVMPAYQQYIQIYRDKADLVINNSVDAVPQLPVDIISAFLQQKINEWQANTQ